MPGGCGLPGCTACPDPRDTLAGATIPERDWDGDIDAYTYAGEQQHPNLLAMVTCEEWVCSDADLARVIAVLAEVQLARLGVG